jgi:hypothetical protein
MLDGSRKSIANGEGLPEDEFWEAVRERPPERKTKRGSD